MDTLNQFYPPFSPAQSTEPDISISINERTNDVSRQAFSNLETSVSDADRGESDPSHLTGAASINPSFEFPSPSQSHFQQHPQSHLYSPTRAEINAHPIRQRLSLASDDAGFVLAPDAETFAQQGDEDLRQAEPQQEEERLFGSMSSDAKNVSEGDSVTYAWGGGRPGGTVADVQTDDNVKMETKRGNEVKKKGEPENPAVYIERGSDHDVVKKASEISIEDKGKGGSKGGASKRGASKGPESSEKKDEKEEKQENGDAKTGEKRSADDAAEDKKDEEAKPDAKKQKANSGKAKQNGAAAASEQPKKKGRPAKTDSEGNPTAKKDTKKRAPKKAATESGEPRRSGRNANK